MRKEDEMKREDWEQIGAEVKIAYLAVTLAYCDVSNMIGKSKKETKLMDKAYEAMSEAKNQLDELICRIDDLNHVVGKDAIRVFYGDFIGNQEKYAVDFADKLLEDLSK